MYAAEILATLINSFSSLYVIGLGDGADVDGDGGDLLVNATPGKEIKLC